MCRGCDRSFTDRSDNPATPSNFCSNSCQRSFQKRQRRNRAGDVSPALRRNIYIRDKYICQICFKPCLKNVPPNSNVYPSVDHIVPVHLGGKSRWNNLQTAHRGCNNRKGAMMMINCICCGNLADYDEGNSDIKFPCGESFWGPLCVGCYDAAYDTHRNEGGYSRNPMVTLSCGECNTIAQQDATADFEMERSYCD